jgi:hypothetical protein
MSDDTKGGLIITGVVGFIVVLILVWFIAVAPIYNVWEKGQEGKAELSQADYNRQVQVVNAQANLQAQKYNAEAEVARAGGVAQANLIIKDTITDQYIRYLWVQTLDKGVDHQIIYVPTEVGLPITEAGRVPSVPTPTPQK